MPAVKEAAAADPPIRASRMRYRLKPSKQQEQWLLQCVGNARFIFNWYLDERIKMFQETGETLSCFTASKSLTLLKKQEDRLWLNYCPAQGLITALNEVDTAYKHFFRRVKEKRAGKEQKAGFPAFRSRRGSQSFSVWQSCTIADGRLHLPLAPRQRRLLEPEYGTDFTEIPIILHRPLVGEPHTVTVIHEPNGDWYVSVVVHQPETRKPATWSAPDGRGEAQIDLIAQPVSDPEAVGVDFGLRDLVVLSDGKVRQSPRWYRRQQRKLRHAQRAASRRYKAAKREARQPQSNNYYRAQKRVAAVHAQTASRRKDRLHKIAYRLVRRWDVICIEDLHPAEVVRAKRPPKDRKGQNKSWQDAGLRMLREMLSYKCAWQGKALIRVGRDFPSSSRCSACGVVQSAPPHGEQWLCPACGACHQRKLNAAKNIRSEGLTILSAARAALMPVKGA